MNTKDKEKWYTLEELRQLPDKKRKYETLKMLLKVAPYYKMYDELRKDIDEFSGKQTTTFEYHGNKGIAEYEKTHSTKTDYKGLFKEHGITDEDKAKYTTRTETMRFKAVHVL